MSNLFKVLEIIIPIFTIISLGIYAKKNNKLSEEACKGLQQFVMTFCLPCVLFNSCLTGDLGMETVTAMVLIVPFVFLSSLWAFRFGRKKYPYHNMPLIFSAKEIGMLGIPLFMILFGAENAYRMGVLDVAQGIVAIPVITILSANTGVNPTPGYVAKKVFQSPLLLMSLLGMAMNLTGAMGFLNEIGVGGIITESTGLIGQPVSAVILFCVGYNFSLEKENRKRVFEICGLALFIFGVVCAAIQGILCLVPFVDMETRWVILLYCALPGSFLSVSLGKTKEESTVAAGVCSILTILCLVVFCIMAVVVI